MAKFGRATCPQIDFWREQDCSTMPSPLGHEVPEARPAVGVMAATQAPSAIRTAAAAGFRPDRDHLLPHRVPEWWQLQPADPERWVADCSSTKACLFVGGGFGRMNNLLVALSNIAAIVAQLKDSRTGDPRPVRLVIPQKIHDAVNGFSLEGLSSWVCLADPRTKKVPLHAVLPCNTHSNRYTKSCRLQPPPPPPAAALGPGQTHPSQSADIVPPSTGPFCPCGVCYCTPFSP